MGDDSLRHDDGSRHAAGLYVVLGHYGIKYVSNFH